MKWKKPPIIKIYEALGAIADERITITETSTSARVYSSSGNKYYEVSYDPENQAIMANDNASYWKGTLGYPAIAFLLTKGVLQYRADIAILLKGIAWKDINQKYRNDFEKTLRHIQNSLERSEWENLSEYTESLSKAIDTLDLNHLGKQKMPPQGY